MNLSFFKDKTVLITGNTGFKGSWMSEILYLAGANVIGYALKPESESLYNTLELDKKTTTYYEDIRNIEALDSVFKKHSPEIAIHMAAQPLVIKAYNDPHYTFETNVMGTLNILETVRKNNCVKSMINVTTDKVYYDNGKFNKNGYKEDDRLCGRDPYSNSKSCSELITYSYNDSYFKKIEFPRVSTVRAGNVIGGGDYSKDRIIPDAIRASINHEAIKIRNPYSVRPFQYVLDCLNGYLTLIEKQYNDSLYQGSYNFGPEEVLSVEELIKLFCDSWGEDQTYININENNTIENNYLKLDSSHSHSLLGWEPKVDIKTTIDRIVSWEKCLCNGGDIIKHTDDEIIGFFDMEDKDVYKYERK